MKRCTKGTHFLTPENTIVEVVKGEKLRRCLECRLQWKARYQRRRHKAQPNQTGVCGKGLHEWIEKNWLINKKGEVRCAACHRATGKKHYREVGHIPCIVKGCIRATTRRGGGAYICKGHRRNPPPWIAIAGLKIVGTSVVAHKDLEMIPRRSVII